MHYICLCFSLQIGCVSEGESELNPDTMKKLCRRQGSSFSISKYDLLFSDCRTLTLSIRSDTYIYKRDTFRIPFSVIELSMYRCECIALLANV